MKKNLFLILIPFSFLFLQNLSSQEKYKDPSLSAEERAVDLCARLTTEEKVSLMMDASRPVERLGIKTYNWWNEALHGVARAGLATVFPQPIGIAATFDIDNTFNVYTAVSDEARAKYHTFVAQDMRSRYQGLTMWTPNVNIFRDPRWGRGIETYGEDPYLSSSMGVAVVKGLQGPKDAPYDKLHACAKHFAVHSGPEWNRHSFDAANISRRDLYETYLPAFKALVQEADVKEVMCAYNRLEGEPCCGNKKLLNYILREEWGYKGIVVADCGAIADFYKPTSHATHADAAIASAEAVLSGTDLDCGSSYKALTESVKKGYIQDKDIDVSVVRLLKARFELGEMDDPSIVPWSHIPYSTVASVAHIDLAYQTALKSMTLLQNKNKILPIKEKGLKIYVMGPNANDSVMQWGNYNGTPSHTVTILQGVKNEFGKNNEVYYEEGCDLIERTIFKSVFNDCKTEKGIGFDAHYWNEANFGGKLVASSHLNTPFQLCTGGATVFAPDVNLTDFSARYTSTFTPRQSGEVFFDFYSCGKIKISVNDKEFKSFRSNHGGRKNVYGLNVVKGESYRIQIDFEYTMGDAQLNFDLGFRQELDLDGVINRVADADLVIFVGGISPQVEGEEMGVSLPGFRGGDRTDIELPAVQREILAGLHQSGKKIIYVNCSGSPIGLVPETQHCEAILQAWYPGQEGGNAVAAVLSGKYNPAGRLPVTFYGKLDQLPDFENYNMKGRTYRYMTDKPLFPFGYGLSYSEFSYGKIKTDKKTYSIGEAVTLKVPVKNSSKLEGEEVVQVYLRKKGDLNGPVKTLRAFKRVYIQAGETKELEIKLDAKQLEWWDETQASMTNHSGLFELLIGSSSDENDLQKIEFKIE